MSDSFTSEQLYRFARTVVDAIGTPSVVVDRSGTIRAANSSFAELMSETGQLTGVPLLAVAEGSLDQPDLREALERILPKNEAFDDLPVDLPDGPTVFVSGKELHAADLRIDRASAISSRGVSCDNAGRWMAERKPRRPRVHRQGVTPVIPVV